MIQKQFQDKLKDFYKKATRKHQSSDALNHALDNYLSYVKREDGSEKDSEGSSLKSAVSGISTDSYQKVLKLFKGDNLTTVILFAYFLSMLYQKRIDWINTVFRNVSQRYKKYEKQISSDGKKNFINKLMNFNEQLFILGQRIEMGCKIDWVYC